MSAALVASGLALCAATLAVAVVSGLRSRPSGWRLATVTIPAADVVHVDSSAPRELGS